METTKQKILIIEDDNDIAEIEKDFLEIHGFEIVIENDGVKGMDRAMSGGFSLLLLDLMLPEKDGMAICREIRTKIDRPILMVTSRLEDAYKVRGLGIGADDYITKPFSPTELVARVKSHIARYQRLTQNDGRGKKSDEIDFGWLRINPDTHEVFVNDKKIAAANKEYELLYFLSLHNKMVFSKEQLYDKIWGEDMYGDVNTVAVHISRLREKIEKAPNEPEHLQTVWGAGYRFLA
jgi:DNA-binding response OmpR family regulator